MKDDVSVLESEEGVNRIGVRHFTAQDADWYQYGDRQIFVGDVLNSSNSETMTSASTATRLKGRGMNGLSPTMKR